MIEFTVYGEPQTQGSFAAIPSRNNGRPFLKASNEAGWRKWRKAVNLAAMNAWGDQPPTDEPLRLEVTFWFGPPPKNRRGEVHCSTKGDGDKLVRAIFDGITEIHRGKTDQKGITTNDSRIVQHMATKLWCDTEDEQRAYVRIEGLNVELCQKVSTLGI